MPTIFDKITDTIATKILKREGKNMTDEEKEVAREMSLDVTYADRPFLKEIKPKRRYEFFSDYFRMDGKFCTIMTYIHPEGKNDRFGVFWGVSRIILPLPDGVTAVSFENIMRYTDGWISQHQSKTEGIVQMNTNEANANGGTSSTKLRNRAQAEELQVIATEIQQGAAYMGVTYRLLLKADSLELLDKTVSSGSAPSMLEATRPASVRSWGRCSSTQASSGVGGSTSRLRSLPGAILW